MTQKLFLTSRSLFLDEAKSLQPSFGEHCEACSRGYSPQRVLPQRPQGTLMGMSPPQVSSVLPGALCPNYDSAPERFSSFRSLGDDWDICSGKSHVSHLRSLLSSALLFTGYLCSGKISWISDARQSERLINPPFLSLICFKVTQRSDAIAVPQTQHQGMIEAHHTNHHFDTEGYTKCTQNRAQN